MLKEIFGQSDEGAFDSIMFDIRYQYALHTTSFKEQPLSKNSLSNFRVAIISTMRSMMLISFKKKLRVIQKSFQKFKLLLDEQSVWIKERRNGKIFVKYTFNITEIPDTVFIETENIDVWNTWFNDSPITINEQGRLDRSFVRKDISKLPRLGDNSVVFELNYFQSEHIYILGDFIFIPQNGYTAGDKDTIISKGNFTIKKPVNNIDISNIVKQGYPFFDGEFTFEKKFIVEKTDYKLCLHGRFSLTEVFVNGIFAAKLMFDNVCDLKEYLKPGENTLTIKLINSNRNLLGPFHCSYDNYSFVRFGLSDIELI